MDVPASHFSAGVPSFAPLAQRRYARALDATGCASIWHRHRPVIGLGAWLFVRWRPHRPDFTPLNTPPDDSLMQDALAEARASLGEFISRAKRPRENALVKLYSVSNSSQVEHLWTEVLEVTSEEELGVRLVTPPVTHSGRLDRLYRRKLDDIEDWQVPCASGKLHGGFSQRAMYAIARRDGIRLPKKLLQLERECRDGSRFHRANTRRLALLPGHRPLRGAEPPVAAHGRCQPQQ